MHGLDVIEFIKHIKITKLKKMPNFILNFLFRLLFSKFFIYKLFFQKERRKNDLNSIE